MIAFLKGELILKDLRSAVIMTQGVGYQVHLTLTDLSKIAEIGDEVSLFIHTCVREDSIELFGFIEAQRKVLFEQLISVSGIGPKTALAMLSGIEPSDFIAHIAGGDHTALTRVPGVGPKTAQRLVLELKDKLKTTTTPLGQLFDAQKTTLDDLRSAVLNLGYKSSVVEKALKAVEPLAKEGHNLEKLVKEALRHLH